MGDHLAFPPTQAGDGEIIEPKLKQDLLKRTNVQEEELDDDVPLLCCK